MLSCSNHRNCRGGPHSTSSMKRRDISSSSPPPKWIRTFEKSERRGTTDSYADGSHILDAAAFIYSVERGSNLTAPFSTWCGGRHKADSPLS